MRIYGKTLPEIFKLLPWPYKIVVTMGTAFFIFAVPYSLNFFFTLGIYTQTVGPLTFSGLPKIVQDVMDPSLAVDKSGMAVLAHTAVKPARVGDKFLYSTDVMLHYSKSPSCRIWTMIPHGYYAQADEALGPDSITPLPAGIWVAETPSIVYDPDDRGKEWKLFVYEYYWTGDDKYARYYSFIGMKTAASPRDEWTQKEWILSADKNRPPMPYSSMVKQNLNSLHKDLANVWFYSRPSVIYHKGVLFMTLSTFSSDTKMPDRIILLASTDHGRTWGYRGTPLRESDIEKMGNFKDLSGASLLVFEDKVYLAAVFGNDKTGPAKVAGLGTFIMPFDNLFNAELQRNAETGVPVLTKWAKRHSVQPSSVGGGHAAFSKGCDNGLLVSEYSDITKSFQIFRTYQNPVGE